MSVFLGKSIQKDGFLIFWIKKEYYLDQKN